MIEGYYVGCPSWGFKDWVGRLYRPGSRAPSFLGQYASVFNAVEGNTSFYGVPSPDSVERWRESTPASFRFCFKLPQEITHRRRLVGADDETAAFLERMAPLGERLGPFMIQLPPSFGPDRLDVLDAFLRRLPGDYDFAVELRHPGFFADLERVDALLGERGCERIVLDTRPLRSGDPGHPDAHCDKPDLPVHPTALGRHPILRFISHPDHATNDPWMERWCGVLRGWIAEGRRPFVFVHCPNDLHSPPLARRLHGMLSATVAAGRACGATTTVGTMPPWPGEREEARREQLSLW